MKALTKVIEKKNLLPSIPILLLVDTISIIVHSFIVHFVKTNLIFTYSLVTCIALIKIIITFYFCQELSNSKCQSKLGYSLFFFLYFWLLTFTTLNRLTDHFSKTIVLSHSLNYLLFFLLNLLGIFFTKWLISNKPWVHILTDFLTILILTPIFYWNPSPFPTTIFVIILILFRYLFIIKLLAGKLSFFFNQKCMIIGELLSFYLLLAVIVTVSKPDYLKISFIPAIILTYILTLYARILFFTKYSFKQKDAKVLFIAIIIFISTTSLVGFLMSLFPNEKGNNIITLTLPAIIPIVFQNLSTTGNTIKKQFIFFKSFQFIKNFLTILLFYTTISINILANLISTKKLPFLLSTLNKFSDYYTLTVYSILSGTFLSIISWLLFQTIFYKPQNGLVKVIINNRKFRKRLHKR